MIKGCRLKGEITAEIRNFTDKSKLDQRGKLRKKVISAENNQRGWEGNRDEGGLAKEIK
jgi:hypothetical protein